MFNHVFRTPFCPSIKLTKRLLTVSEIPKCATVNFCHGIDWEQSSHDIVRDDMLKNSISTNLSVKIQLDLARKNNRKLEEVLTCPEKMKLFKMIEVEIAVARTQGMLVPHTLTSKHWITLLNLPSFLKRRKFISYIRIGEIKEENAKAKKKLSAQEKFHEEENIEDLKSKYGLHGNTMFLRIYKQSMSDFYDNKLVAAQLFAPKVVFDFSFERYMMEFEWSYCARQILMAYSDNRHHPEPFNLYFCNANKDDPVMERLHSRMPQLYEESFLVNVTSKCYTDIFDKRKLVYLTPHCNTFMTEFNSDLVYIIGAVVDKRKSLPVTLAKAKEQRITMMKLPLDRYLQWGAGSTKNLTLNQVLLILLDMHYTNDWHKALKHVPRRKLLEATKERIMRSLENPESVFTKYKRRKRYTTTFCNS